MPMEDTSAVSFPETKPSQVYDFLLYQNALHNRNAFAQRVQKGLSNIVDGASIIEGTKPSEDLDEKMVRRLLDELNQATLRHVQIMSSIRAKAQGMLEITQTQAPPSQYERNPVEQSIFRSSATERGTLFQNAFINIAILAGMPKRKVAKVLWQMLPTAQREKFIALMPDVDKHLQSVALLPSFGSAEEFQQHMSQKVDVPYEGGIERMPQYDVWFNKNLFMASFEAGVRMVIDQSTLPLAQLHTFQSTNQQLYDKGILPFSDFLSQTMWGFVAASALMR